MRCRLVFFFFEVNLFNFFFFLWNTKRLLPLFFLLMVRLAFFLFGFKFVSFNMGIVCALRRFVALSMRAQHIRWCGANDRYAMTGSSQFHINIKCKVINETHAK